MSMTPARARPRNPGLTSSLGEGNPYVFSNQPGLINFSSDEKEAIELNSEGSVNASKSKGTGEPVGTVAGSGDAHTWDGSVVGRSRNKDSIFSTKKVVVGVGVVCV